MFIKDKVMPNGAQARYHKAVKFEVQESGTHAVVNSYHSEDMSVISWQDTYVIPSLIKIETLADVEYILTYANAPFEGGVIVPDETATLDSKKARKKAEVKLERDKAEWAGVATPKGVVDSDPESQRKINGAVTMALIGGQDFSIDWRMKDDSIVSHNRDEMIALGQAVGQHTVDCQSRKNELDALIDAAQTEEELLAIDITSGWPT